MLPTEFNLKLYAGDTETFIIRWKTLNGLPKDLTGFTATMQILQKRTEEHPLTFLAVIDPKTSEIVFNLSARDTRVLLGITELQRRSFIYDVQLEDSDKNITTIVRGKCYVYADTTRGFLWRRR
jgi:hypothetical protein